MDADVARIRSRQRLMRSEVCAGCGMVVGRAREGTGRDAAGRLQEAPKRTREEHLLAAVMSDAATQRLLGQVGRLPDAGAVVAEVRQGTPARGLSAVEVDALAELGIARIPADGDELCRARMGIVLQPWRDEPTAGLIRRVSDDLDTTIPLTGHGRPPGVRFANNRRQGFTLAPGLTPRPTKRARPGSAAVPLAAARPRLEPVRSAKTTTLSR